MNVFRKLIEDAVEKSKGKSCITSNSIYKTTMQEISRQQVQFDKETEHGVKQGAYFGGVAFQAIAFSQSTGQYGFAYDYSTQEEAEKVAIEYCNSSDCKIVIWSTNACSSLARGDESAYGTSWAKDSKTAEAKAMELCKKYSNACKILKTVCPNE